jgi:hypothetical protein
LAHLGQAGGQIDGGGRFTDTTFLICDAKNLDHIRFGWASWLRFCGSTRA